MVWILNAQESTADETGSYILTVKGEKIPILPNEDITVSVGVAVYYVRSKDKTISPYNTEYYRTEKTMRIKKIAKIVHKDELYLPFRKKNGKLRMYRLVATSKDYILGHYILTPPPGRMGVWFYSSWYVILNKNNEVIENAKVFDEFRKPYPISVNNVKKYFGNCLDTDSLIVDVKTKTFARFLGNGEFTKEKQEEWEAYAKRGRYKTHEPCFLPNVNQLVCE